ncbi:MAG: hypothetical protein FWD66_05610 [Paludibacter sp.]|nr:hypothetical protein [Paludibacter sp.]
MEKVKTNTFGKTSEIRTNEPKRLSKAGQWRRDNPGGIIVVLDRRAVNK